MDSRNLYLYWVGKEYNLIKILRELIYLHSTHGKGYTVHLITDQNIRDYVTPPDYFYKLCPAHQADFVRVHAICQYGGIWLDSDTLVMDTLDTLFDKLETGDGFFIKENNTTLCNGVFGSKKQTPLMLEWKKQLLFKLNAKQEHVSWCEIGNDILQTIYAQHPNLYSEYEIMNGLDNVYPVNWCNCVNEYMEKPYENYKNLTRPYQPLVILVNSVYKALESKSVDEIRNGMMPLNYFINQSYESNYRVPSIKKYVLITPWIKDYITLEHYTFAKNLTYFGWELIETNHKEIPSTDKCIVLCITYDDIDISVYKRDHIFLIYKIDDLYPYKSIRKTCIQSADLIIGPYQYLFDTKEIENLYGNISIPQLHIPYSAVNQFYQSCVFNSNPILKIFISGCDNQSIYPFRYYMNHHPPLKPYIEKLIHPEYTSYTHDTINKKYYETLNRYLCCFTDASNYKYILLKVFEIGSVGSLLLVDDTIQEELSKLGFHDLVNCILCNPSNVQQKMKFILNQENRKQIDEIRLKGMNLVRERHHTFHRSFVFNSKIDHSMFTIMDKIGGSNKETFEFIYKNKIWNNQDDRIPISGPGSTIENSKECSKWIHQFIQDHSCDSLLDLGCGDLTWMSQSLFFKENTIEYTGIDVVEPLIQSHSKRFTEKTFLCEDITKYVPTKKYSIILIRYVLFNLKNNEILSIFENIKGKFDFIMITSCKNVNNHDHFDKWKFSEKNIHIEPFNKNKYDCVLEEPVFNKYLYLYSHDSFYTYTNSIFSYPVFVIHLARSQRESSFKENIKNAGYSNVSVFEAVDGYDMNSVNKAMSLFHNPSIDRDIRKGQLGCLLSHMKLLKHIVDHHIQISTIFEDDICFHPDWNRLYNLYYESTPNNYDVIFMGNQLDSCRRIDTITPLITTEPVFCTHAYMITLEGARKLLHSLIHWDYAHFLNWENTRFTGLTAIDVMIKDIQHKTLHGIINQPFIWYSWNGTKYPCDYNRLPVTEKNCKNTGLVFQDAELTSLIVGSTPYENPITEPINNRLYTNNHNGIKHKMSLMLSSPDTSIKSEPTMKSSYRNAHVINKPIGLIFSEQYTSRPVTVNTPELRNTVQQQSRVFPKMKFHAFTHLSV